MTSTELPLEAIDLPRVQRRTVGVLAGSQVLSGIAIAGSVAAGRQGCRGQPSDRVLKSQTLQHSRGDIPAVRLLNRSNRVVDNPPWPRSH